MVISMYSMVFSSGKCTEWDIILGCENFKYFGVLDSPDIFFFWGGGGGGGEVNNRCWFQAYI